ncbi:CRE-SCP-1 protein, partial [Aphelenchoides avenae]
MNRVVTEKRWTLRDRVSRAYYDYGRLCSAHPLSCFSISIITILFLSYPAFLRIRLPASSPMDVYWSQRLSIDPNENDSMPEWLYLSSSAYIQQIIVQATVEPWEPESSDATQ